MRTSFLSRLAPPLCLAALVLSGCGLFEDANRLGASATGDGGVRAHFVPCPGQDVTRVALVAQIGTGVSIESGNDVPGDDPDDDEIVVWQAGSPEGSSETTFDVGVTPPGFVEEIPLEGRPTDYSGIGVFVGYRSGEGLASLEVGFDQDDLRTGTILTLGGEKDPDTFRAEGEALCE